MQMIKNTQLKAKIKLYLIDVEGVYIR